MKTKPHTIDGEAFICFATVHPASKKAIKLVLSAKEGDDNGRSEYVWVRLMNGDLVLAIFPRGDTYFAVEKDAQYPQRSADVR